ncbi:MAG TPA: M28 family peptidase [Fimbriimonadaceae bacterium]|nr:M28 family peptidase [Fimbriimonadaceae bacterium]
MFQQLFCIALAWSPANFSTTDIALHVRTLSDPKLEGRMTMTKGGDLAATYIAAHFRRIGLHEGPNKGYFHTWEFSHGFRPKEDSSLTVFLPGGKTQVLRPREDFVPLPGTAEKPVSGDIVYVGFGLEDASWNDYANVDVRGKIVLMLRGVPEGQRQASHGAKAALAASKGAIGVIFAGPTAPGRAELPPLNRAAGVRADTGVAAAAVTGDVFRSITGLTYEAARAQSPGSGKVTGASARIAGGVEENSGLAKNVIGYLPGRDSRLRNEYIIVGAHYDHLGHGEVGSMSGSGDIHPGADDNASGTAAVMMLAEHFAKTKSNRRTMIFQLYSGEELGLLGSRAWTNFNTDKLARTSAMINLDMVGRLRDGKLSVFGTSSAEEWPGLLGKVNVPNVQLVTAPNVRADSDQAAFAAQKVPVLFFHTGLHPEYHTERDRFETVNVQGIAQVCEVVAQVLKGVDALSRKLEFSEKTVMGNLPGDRRATGDSQRRVRIGFIPDMAAGGPGVRITGASPDSPAAKAGFKEGDRILSFDGKKIESLEDLQAAMVAARVGQRVKVRYLRDDREHEVELTVEARA